MASRPVTFGDFQGIVAESPTPDSFEQSRRILLILLHGYGADMHDLAGLAPYLTPGVNLLCLQGLMRSPFGGRSWFDIQYLPDGSLQFDEKQALATGELMAQTLKMIIAERSTLNELVILGGFSQGAGVAMLTAILVPEILQGLLLMSGRCPDHIGQLISDTGKFAHLPVFIGHGTQDQVLKIQNGRDLKTFWQKLPVWVTYQEYLMGHEISANELQDINSWLESLTVQGDVR